MRFPNAAQEAGGGGRIETRQLPEGTWESFTSRPGVEPIKAHTEVEAIRQMSQKLYNKSMTRTDQH